jgi:hypothetical protein
MGSTRFHGTCRLSLITKSAGLMIWAVYFSIFWHLHLPATCFRSLCMPTQGVPEGNLHTRSPFTSEPPLTHGVPCVNESGGRGEIGEHTAGTGGSASRHGSATRQAQKYSLQKMDCHHERRECCLVEKPPPALLFICNRQHKQAGHDYSMDHGGHWSPD